MSSFEFMKTFKKVFLVFTTLEITLTITLKKNYEIIFTYTLI